MSNVLKFLPRFLVCGLRAAWILVHRRGQTRRDADGNCVDAQGEPLPWLTYPAIDFLDSLELRGRRVFEFGSGGSTLFWARRGATVCSVEHHVPWFEKMKKHAGGTIMLIGQPDLAKYPEEIRALGEFDIILVDGAERMNCTRSAIEHLAPDGMLILDNSEWYPNCCKFLRDKELTQIDFCGFGPLNSFTSTTSVFIRGRIAFPHKQKPPSWTPIGGSALERPPPDDF
ncbi:MAG: SAM-dependent methyltransferase [Rhodoplanes sp.]|uniref:hypothetical protein n=1 Tax=Rhodoplanes sp. TaxID=1968906 RepID=UPI001834421B|nr:hypothetical protein [Rhodoplanes sp.]NVO13646.1 SAM-dependent methyltransferase [Rhodoplanes sp.]